MVSGPPAVGKTTVAKALGEKFNLQYVSGGDVLKEIASECGFNTSGDDWWDTSDGLKFLKIRSENDEYDRRVDEKLAKAYNAGGAVMTSYVDPPSHLVRSTVWYSLSLPRLQHCMPLQVFHQRAYRIRRFQSVFSEILGHH